MKSKVLLLQATPIVALTVAMDQASKAAARHFLTICAPHLCPQQHLAGPLELVRILNRGSAFGLGPGLWIWVLFAAIGVLLIPVYCRRVGRVSLVAVLGVGLQLGGALGNLIDRILFGQVTDFIWIRGWSYIINAADLALTAGMLLALATLLRRTGVSSEPGASS